MDMADIDDVARWMASEVDCAGFLYQETAVAHIADDFGAEFLSTDQKGDRAIAPAVLEAFHRLTKDLLIWDRWDKCWRHRDLGYPPGPRGPHERPLG